LIMPEASLDTTHARAEQILQLVRDLHVSHRGHSLGTVTISAGVATFPEHGRTGESVIRAADTALYLAKAEGRDRVVVAGLDDEPRGRPASDSEGA
jgi:diguanylate cyclase (GGDEF)-like protein